MRGVPALAEALDGVAGISVLVLWEPVIPTDRRPPGRWVTSPLDATRPPGGLALFWDEELIASRSMVRTALRNPERIPEGVTIDEGFVVWDAVAIWPPGTRWEGDMPWPEWVAYPVVDAAPELRRRLLPGSAVPAAPR